MLFVFRNFALSLLTLENEQNLLETLLDRFVFLALEWKMKWKGSLMQAVESEIVSMILIGAGY